MALPPLQSLTPEGWELFSAPPPSPPPHPIHILPSSPSPLAPSSFSSFIPAITCRLAPFYLLLICLSCSHQRDFYNANHALPFPGLPLLWHVNQVRSATPQHSPLPSRECSCLLWSPKTASCLLQTLAVFSGGGVGRDRAGRLNSGLSTGAPVQYLRLGDCWHVGLSMPQTSPSVLSCTPPQACPSSR